MKYLFLILLTLPFFCFSQNNKKQILKPIQKNVVTCSCGCGKQVYGLIDFYTNIDPKITYSCSDLGELTVNKIPNSIGLYTIESNLPFNADRTWIYIQSENSNWREIQAQVQPDGKIWLQAVQDETLTNIVTQNVSFKIVCF